ncbi:hypothetical protein [Nocardioides litoris]|uniref:hypothetical protein n=1 Tax=Nocardioides litoris TaxID=1926648 RepID=UPI001122D9D5|nr:hypothetical protein [Nocardioides litoris]
MGSTYHYLAAPGTDTLVPDRLAALLGPPSVRSGHGSTWAGTAGPPDRPVVSLFPPRQHRADVWTVGEVHFLGRRGLDPAADRARAGFARWWASYPVVFRQPSAAGGCDDWAWQLRGSVRNTTPVLRATPSGEEALGAGVFFVADGDDGPPVAAVLREMDRLR